MIIARNKKFLVTGGAGFLGLHLANQLHQRGNKVLSMDIAKHNPEEYQKEIECHTVDVRSADFWQFLDGVDVVIHGAAALPAWKEKEIYAVNVLGTRNVLEGCLRHHVWRVVYISTSGVYGLSDKNPMEEEDPLVGIGPYATTKIEGEKICHEYRKKGLCIPILRPTPIVGVGRLGAFQILFDWVQSGKKIPIIGNGKNRYQLLHVDDFIEAILLAAEGKENLVNTEFNVGAKVFEAVARDVGALCDFAKTGSKVLRTPARPVQKILRVLEILKLSPFYQWFYESANKDSFVSTQRLEQLGWSPQKSNQDCLMAAYQWYLKNKNNLRSMENTSRGVWKQGLLQVVKILF